ncbi:hypothetical protein [Sinorhizobium meliloti]|uniref:hypothetical protein n=1 Tax=Rhizobium meliloti TaxID=382 RepID=UPI000FD777CF|nr:hypothetical protein [Sinorhizobium meliloti]RVN04637.1 hypothetical protein CN112_24925 [Sinorhizobium meliloti]
MVKFVKNFLVGAAVVGGATACLLGGIVGPFAFFYWLSGGAFWGLMATITTTMALAGGVAFVFEDAQ